MPDPAAPTIRLRDAPPRTVWALEQAGVPPLLARLFAGRGVRAPDELDDGLARLLPPAGLLGVQAAARLLADAIAQRRRVCVVADYDCDGATACAVALRGLGLLGAAPDTLHYVVPDRALHGYGLTPAIVDLAREKRPDLLLTVDNGIASLQGVAHARAQGIDVLVTDHHLPARVDDAVVLPDANVIVNPNQPGCSFGSKNLAGVGVIFYVLLALRAELRERGVFTQPSAATGGDSMPAQPRLDTLLDLVALGTVADVVRLDANNRRLVAQGLRRIRAGQMQPGVAALFGIAARDARRASAFDFGFALGPRINAAGRLSDMTLGIECLLTDDPARAAELATLLDTINRERREVESGMREQAEAMLERLMQTHGERAADSPSTGTTGTPFVEPGGTPGVKLDRAPSAKPEGAPSGKPEGAPSALAIFDEGFHEGVVGIVASRLKDRVHRPTFVFARGQDGLLKGSGRSIPGFHLRDALDLLSKRHPDVLLRFGGHAMAAGCTLAESQFASFDAAFRRIAGEWLDAATLSRTLFADGPLGIEHFNATTVRALEAQVWGQAFEPPLFVDAVEIVAQRLVGEKHLKLSLRFAGEARGAPLRDAIWFGRSEPLPAQLRLAYRLGVDAYNGRERVQMIVEGIG
ncbi:MAG: single-stranded-DNA-specific exonuclease RecJ [Burkholderiaceae bacterium]